MSQLPSRLVVLSILLLGSAPLCAGPVGYRVPEAGGPHFASMEAVYDFAARHEIPKYLPQSAEIPGVTPPNVIAAGPHPIKAKSHLDWITTKRLGALFILHLPNWCGHEASSDHVVYVLRKSAKGLQLIGRTESGDVCRVSDGDVPVLTCGSYHGAKGASRQEWNGKAFQSTRLLR